jgi:hypothetical protein
MHVGESAAIGVERQSAAWGGVLMRDRHRRLAGSGDAVDVGGLEPGIGQTASGYPVNFWEYELAHT